MVVILFLHFRINNRAVELYTHSVIIATMNQPELKQRFYKVFANLPINLREEVILVIPEKGPITWQVAYLEIDNETVLGGTILEKLSDLQII